MRSDKPLSLCTSVFMTEYFIWKPKTDDNMSDLKNKITTKAFARDQGSISPFSAKRPYGFWHRCFTSGNFVWQSRDNLAKFENMNVIHEHRKTTHVKVALQNHTFAGNLCTGSHYNELNGAKGTVRCEQVLDVNYFDAKNLLVLSEYTL